MVKISVKVGKHYFSASATITNLKLQAWPWFAPIFCGCKTTAIPAAISEHRATHGPLGSGLK